MKEILPDTRSPGGKGSVRGPISSWIPIFCANCGKEGGMVPEATTNFAFWLCDNCHEAHGPIAATMIVPDEVIWGQEREKAAEQQAKRGE